MKRITFLTFAFLSLYATSTLYAQNLVAHFKFDNDLTDETGTYTLSTTNAPSISYVQGHDGTTNGAITGFGVSDYLATNQNVNIINDASRTVTAWIKTNVGTNGTRTQRGIVKWGNEAPQEKFTLMLINNRLRNEIQTGGISGPADGTLINGVWRHVAAVYDKSTNTSTIYKDGVEVANKDWDAVSLKTVAAPLWIGNDSGNSGERGFEGAIDDVRVYDGALTGTQIQSLYSGGTLSNKEVSSISVKFYPNPVQDHLHIDNDEVAIVDIYDIVGLKLNTNKVRDGRLSLGNLNKGIYVLTCKDAQNKFIATVKVIKD